MNMLQNLILTSMLPLFLFFGSEEGALKDARVDVSTGYYHLATVRLERILREYPKSRHRSEMLLLIVKSYALSHREAEAIPHLRALLREFPEEAARLDPKFLKLLPAASPPSPVDSVPKGIFEPVPPEPANAKAPLSHEVARGPEIGAAAVAPAPVAPDAAAPAAAAQAPAEKAEPPQAGSKEVPAPGISEEPKSAVTGSNAPVTPPQTVPAEEIATPAAVAPAAIAPATSAPATSAPAPAEKSEPPQAGLKEVPAPGISEEPKSAVTGPSAPVTPPQTVPAEEIVAPAAAAPAPVTPAPVTPAPVAPAPVAPAPVTPAPAEKAEPPQSGLKEVPAPVISEEPKSAVTDSTPAPPPPPAREATPVVGNDIVGGYTLFAGETINRAELTRVTGKLVAAGLQPLFSRGRRNVVMHRLVSGCYHGSKEALKRRRELAGVSGSAFIFREGDSFCAAAGSFASVKIAEQERKRLSGKGVDARVVPFSMNMPYWSITAGRFPDAATAEKALQRVSAGGLKIVVRPIKTDRPQ